MEDENYEFKGFGNPNYTQVPDELFDELMCRLDNAELRVLLYIIRRTFGFKRSSDDISLNQMAEGIRRKNGRPLDHGTGLSRASVKRALRGLLEKKVITTQRNRSPERGNEPTTYALRLRESPRLAPDPSPLGSPMRQALAHVRAPQETVEQETDVSLSNTRRAQEPVDNFDERGAKNRDAPPDLPSQPDTRSRQAPSPGEEAPSVTRKSHRWAAPARGGDPQTVAAVLSRSALRQGPTEEDDAHSAIGSYIAEFAAEFGDQAPLKSSVTRAYNLYRQSGRSLEAFIDQLYRSRGAVRERTGAATSLDGRKAPPIHNKMSYFFGVLADDLGLSPPSEVKEGARAAP